jgi:prepilin peptidase CpaA
MLQTLSHSLLPILLIAAAASDALSFRIPNWLTALTALLFFPMALATAMPLHEFGAHLLAGVLLFAVGFGFFQLNLFGGGDAKLMAAAGLWFGTSQVLPFLFMTALAGGLLGLVIGFWSMMSISWEIHAENIDLAGIGRRLRGLKPNVPYGLAFAIGGIIVFKDSWWMNLVA